MRRVPAPTALACISPELTAGEKWRKGQTSCGGNDRKGINIVSLGNGWAFLCRHGPREPSIARLISDPIANEHAGRPSIVHAFHSRISQDQHPRIWQMDAPSGKWRAPAQRVQRAWSAEPEASCFHPSAGFFPHVPLLSSWCDGCSFHGNYQRAQPPSQASAG